MIELKLINDPIEFNKNKSSYFPKDVLFFSCYRVKSIRQKSGRLTIETSIEYSNDVEFKETFHSLECNGITILSESLMKTGNDYYTEVSNFLKKKREIIKFHFYRL